jgi:hypothetical protein
MIFDLSLSWNEIMLKDPKETRLVLNNDEFDAFTGWRKVIPFGRGGLKKIKRGYSRRFRHSVRVLLAREARAGE